MTRLQQRIHGFVWLFLAIGLTCFVILTILLTPPVILADAPSEPALILPSSEGN
jgi:hypothetical protein